MSSLNNHWTNLLWFGKPGKSWSSLLILFWVLKSMLFFSATSVILPELESSISNFEVILKIESLVFSEGIFLRAKVATLTKSSFAVILIIWKPNSVSTNPILPTLFLKTKSLNDLVIIPSWKKPKSPPFVLDGPSEFSNANVEKLFEFDLTKPRILFASFLASSLVLLTCGVDPSAPE